MEEESSRLREACTSLMRAVLHNLEQRITEGEEPLGSLCADVAAEARRLPQERMHDLAEFVLLPFFKALPSFVEWKQEGRISLLLKERDVEALLGALRVVLESFGVDFVLERSDIAFQVLDSCLCFLDNSFCETDEHKLASICLIQFLADVECMREHSLVKSTLWFTVGEDVSLHGFFAQTVLLLIETVKRNRSKEVSYQSLVSLRRLLECVSLNHPNRVQDVLPGICSSAAKLMLGDFKVGSRVRAAAVDVFRVSVMSVLSDERELEQDKKISRNDQNWMDDFVAQRKSRERNALKTICHEVNRIAREMIACEYLFGSSNTSAQTSLLLLARSLLAKCKVTILDNDEELYCTVSEHLISLAPDLREGVIWDDDAWLAIVSPKIHRNLVSSVARLPILARSGNESAFRTELNYSRVLLSSLDAAVLRQMLTRSQALVEIAHALELELDENLIVHEALGFPKRRMRHFCEPETERCVEGLLSVLVEREEPMVEVIFTRLWAILGELLPECVVLRQIDTSGSESVPCTVRGEEIVFLLQAFARLVRFPGTEKFEQHCQFAVEVLTCNEATEFQVSLVLEFLGNWFAIVGEDLNSNARKALVIVLFPVVERLASANSNVADSARAALKCIARACRYECNNSDGVAVLLEKNMDYVLDAAVSRLTNLSLFPNTPRILQAVFQAFSEKTPSFLDAYFRDLAESILLSLKTSPTSESGEVLKTLRFLLQLFIGDDSNTDHPKRLEREDLFTQLLRELEDIDRFEVIKYDSDDEEEGDEAETEPGKPPMGTPTEISKKVLHQARHYTICGHDIWVRREALELCEACLLCARNETREHLLPMVHDIWEGIEASLKRENKPAISAVSFRLVRTCLLLSGSFIQVRFQAVVLPVALHSISSVSKTRHGKELVVEVIECLIVAVQTINFRREQIQILFVESQRLQQSEGKFQDLANVIFDKYPDEVWLFRTQHGDQM